MYRIIGIGVDGTDVGNASTPALAQALRDVMEHCGAYYVVTLELPVISLVDEVPVTQ